MCVCVWSVGTDSYKQHGYRLLLIWLSCLRREDNPIKQLFVALVAIDVCLCVVCRHGQLQAARLPTAVDLAELLAT